MLTSSVLDALYFTSRMRTLRVTACARKQVAAGTVWGCWRNIPLPGVQQVFMDWGAAGAMRARCLALVMCAATPGVSSRAACRCHCAGPHEVSGAGLKCSHRPGAATMPHGERAWRELCAGIDRASSRMAAPWAEHAHLLLLPCCPSRAFHALSGC